jgi:CPA1 family monovalent cation:H+ antiporter
MFNIFALFITIVAIASFINHRYIKLPSTIGLMVIGLFMSLVVVGAGYFGIEIRSSATAFLEQIDFSETLMKGMLSFLLFAGAIKINLDDLARQKFVVATMATVGVVATTFIVGTSFYYVLGLLGLSLSFAFCLVFGALIAPTDPVAVLSILKSLGASKSLETKIAGESLFNDGVGIVVFLVLVGIATQGNSVDVLHVAALFFREAVGGVVFGLLIGYAAYRLIKKVDEHSVEVLLTLGLVCGGYALATKLHVSGPISIVVAGLLIGNYGRRLAMSASTRNHLDNFWELIDEILSAVLFIWIGFEVLVLSLDLAYVIAGLAAIPLSLAARFISIWSTVFMFKFRRQFSDNAVLILTWGGIRGGISIALALSLASGFARDVIVTATYIVVIFSILAQGLTIKKLLK